MAVWWACLVAFEAAALLHLDAADKQRPVTKVVNLLKDMQAQLQKEQSEDEETYEKVSCWCQTNDRTKSAELVAAEQRMSDLQATIEEQAAAGARLNVEIQNLDEDIAESQQQLEKATKIRAKEYAEFHEEEKELIQSITAIKSAVVVLSRFHGMPEEGQPGYEDLVAIGVMVKHAYERHRDLLDEAVTPEEQDALNAVLASPAVAADALLQDATQAGAKSKQTYSPASAEIFGLLYQMKETFEKNMSDGQKEEMASQQAFDQLKAAKDKEIGASQTSRDTKVQQQADAAQLGAQARQDLEDTRNALTADQKFLLDLKQRCARTDEEWSQRQALRQGESKAIAEAIAVLANDDAHDTFSATLGFVQLEEHAPRQEAAQILRAAAKKSGSKPLLALAQQAASSAVQKVLKAIDDMVASLAKEQQDEVKLRQYCQDELNQNAKQQEHKQRDMDGLDAKKLGLEQGVGDLGDAIQVSEQSVEEMTSSLKRAGEDRAAEQKDFQIVIADQRATQEVLRQAVVVLRKFYDQHASLVQRQEPRTEVGLATEAPPPPSGFGAYKTQSSGGVIGLLEQIFREAKQLEADAVSAEQEAQAAYESFARNTNVSIEKKQREMTNRQSEKAETEVDLTANGEAKQNALHEQRMNKNEEADLHKSCDFVLQNFDLRQTARSQEMEALGQAKAILSGAGFTAFLQRR